MPISLIMSSIPVLGSMYQDSLEAGLATTEEAQKKEQFFAVVDSVDNELLSFDNSAYSEALAVGHLADVEVRLYML